LHKRVLLKNPLLITGTIFKNEPAIIFLFGIIYLEISAPHIGIAFQVMEAE